MRLANVSGAATLITPESTLDAPVGLDVSAASGGRFGPDLAPIYASWAEFRAWAGSVDLTRAEPLDPGSLGPPTPAPRQIFAVGLNYGEHAAESGFERPDELPPVFTKFVTSLAGPLGDVALPPGGHTDWEVELGVILAAPLFHADEDQARRAIAGYTVTQDLSERIVQLRGPAPQFSLGKSFPGFLPSGPWLTTLDEVADPDNLALSCAIDGETVQESTTASLLFSVPALLAGLSAVLPLEPGDLVLSGTPEGVGLGRDPQRWLQAGEVLTSTIEGLGELRQTFH